MDSSKLFEIPQPCLVCFHMYSLSASTVRVPDAGIYTVGLAVFPSHNPLHHALPATLSAPQPPTGGIEVRRNLSLFIHVRTSILLIVKHLSLFFLRCCCSRLWALFRQAVCPPWSFSLSSSAHKSKSDSRPTDLTVITPACTYCYPVSPTLKHTHLTRKIIRTSMVIFSRCHLLGLTPPVTQIHWHAHSCLRW